MEALRQVAAQRGIELPLNLGLNDGTYMPAACVDVLQRNAHRLGLRNYTTPNNDPLRETIADLDGVTPEHVFLRNGSGPILKQVVPHLIRTSIKASPKRIAKHLWNKSGFPVVTPKFTYSKVPKKGAEMGFTIHLVELGPENGWKLDVSQIDRHLRGGDGMVYIANPNNPTGNVLVTREQIIPLLKKYPRTWFWIDEAYVQYVDDSHHRFSDLVPKFNNLVVGRTFSFAYGLAGARIGYMLAPPGLVREMSGQLTNYRLGTLQEELAIAALRDEDHLPWLREECARERKHLIAGMSEHAGVECWDTEVNFVFARFTDGRTGAELKTRMAERGIATKCFEPFAGTTYHPYFRITLGTHEENAFFLEQFAEVMQVMRPR